MYFWALIIRGFKITYIVETAHLQRQFTPVRACQVVSCAQEWDALARWIKSALVLVEAG